MLHPAPGEALLLTMRGIAVQVEMDLLSAMLLRPGPLLVSLAQLPQSGNKLSQGLRLRLHSILHSVHCQWPGQALETLLVIIPST